MQTFHVVESVESAISIPDASSSFRIESAREKSFCFLASARSVILFSMSCSLMFLMWMRLDLVRSAYV